MTPRAALALVAALHDAAKLKLGKQEPAPSAGDLAMAEYLKSRDALDRALEELAKPLEAGK